MAQGRREGRAHPAVIATATMGRRNIPTVAGLLLLLEAGWRFRPEVEHQVVIVVRLLPLAFPRQGPVHDGRQGAIHQLEICKLTKGHFRSFPVGRILLSMAAVLTHISEDYVGILAGTDGRVVDDLATVGVLLAVSVEDRGPALLLLATGGWWRAGAVTVRWEERLSGSVASSAG